jgi:hypothetical protein
MDIGTPRAALERAAHARRRRARKCFGVTMRGPDGSGAAPPGGRPLNVRIRRFCSGLRQVM